MLWQVFAHRPVANVDLDHTMHLGDKESEKEQDDKEKKEEEAAEAVEVIIDEHEKKLTVSYTCIFPGSTAVTLVHLNLLFKNAELRIDSPMLVKNGLYADPALSNVASRGLTLKAGRTRELDLTWNCKFEGTAVATIVLPVRPSTHPPLTHTPSSSRCFRSM